jgi:hypothetical protein
MVIELDHNDLVKLVEDKIKEEFGLYPSNISVIFINEMKLADTKVRSEVTIVKDL